MDKKRIGFKFWFVIYVTFLGALLAAALLYVSNVLKEYEAAVPENVAVKAYLELQLDLWHNEDAFWEKNNLPEVNAGRLESGLDIKKEYIKRLTMDGSADLTEKSGNADPDKLVYIYNGKDGESAEITLRATSESMTKLAILTYRTWEVESIRPILEKKAYTLTVPTDFSVKVNGLELSEEEITSQNAQETAYAISDLYLTPTIEIADAEGNAVSYQIVNGQIVAEFYYFTFWLPPSITVEVNGQKLVGDLSESGINNIYQIKELAEPKVVVKDLYGNVIEYKAGDDLPLKHRILTVDSRHKVQVNGAEPPVEVMTITENPEFSGLEEYVENLPKVHTYDIAVLDESAKICVVTERGSELTTEDEDVIRHDYLRIAGLNQEVPSDVAAEIDVLAVAQEWSLFMSNDRDFAEIAEYMVKNCYQYEVARKYYNSVDRKFFSSHILLDPAFTDNKVENFRWITDDCFSVDVSFVKHLQLKRKI